MKYEVLLRVSVEVTDERATLAAAHAYLHDKFDIEEQPAGCSCAGARDEVIGGLTALFSQDSIVDAVHAVAADAGCSLLEVGAFDSEVTRF